MWDWAHKMAPGILNTMAPHVWLYLRYWWNRVNTSSTGITFDRLYIAGWAQHFPCWSQISLYITGWNVGITRTFWISRKVRTFPVYHVDFWCHTISVGWNLGLTRKFWIPWNAHVVHVNPGFHPMGNVPHPYSLFTVRKSSSLLILSGEPGFLRVNTL